MSRIYPGCSICLTILIILNMVRIVIILVAPHILTIVIAWPDSYLFSEVAPRLAEKRILVSGKSCNTWLHFRTLQHVMLPRHVITHLRLAFTRSVNAVESHRVLPICG